MIKAKNGTLLFQVVRLIAPWFAFWAFIAWGWRVHNPFTHIPAYGDVLEVVWGIEWYYDSIVVHHSSPLFTSLVFHPLGWHTATLTHTPLFFLISLPLYALGGTAFAYNAIAVLSLVVGFAGTFRFLRLFSSESVATIGSLIFLSMGRTCFIRVGGGHLHTAWISSLLPWLAWILESAHRSGYARSRCMVLAGVIWGVAIHFGLYATFMGALIFALWGIRLLQFRWIKRAVVAGWIALIVGLPAIVPYLLGSRQDHSHFYGIEHNMWWGASLNSLFVPNVFHPLPAFRSIARSIYTGPLNESGVMNLGLTVSLLTLVGLAIVIRKRRQSGLISVVSLIFAGGWRNSSGRCIISGNLTAGGGDDLPEHHF